MFDGNLVLPCRQPISRQVDTKYVADIKDFLPLFIINSSLV